MNEVEVQQGESPIVLGFPHSGTWVPSEVQNSLSPNGRLLADTDWHVDRLYDGLLKDVTSVRANFHRYVVDANRAPDGQSLYPGQNTTELVPTTDFDGNSIWNVSPTESDIASRTSKYHAEYHRRLRSELNRIRAIHGAVILFDCHSIRSNIPHLFDGQLPDLNVGTFNGTTCASSIEESVVGNCKRAQGYTAVLNGRFKGGWTTRHYGDPDGNVHAIQLELAQSTYLESEKTPFNYDKSKADRLRVVLRSILESLLSVFDVAIKEMKNHE